MEKDHSSELSRRQFLIAAGITVAALVANPVDVMAAEEGPKKCKTGEVVYKGDTKQPFIYLTIDDWYQRSFIEASLDIARKEKVHFTYFPIGKVISPNKDLVIRAVKEGHEIANHTWDHNKLGKGHLSSARIGSEIDMQCEAVTKILGSSYKQHFVRPPGGSGILGSDYNPAILTEAKKRKLKVAMWGPDSRGWVYGPVREDEEAKNYVLQNIVPHLWRGSIILQHAIGPDIAALPEIIHAAKKKGLKMITMSEGIEVL